MDQSTLVEDQIVDGRRLLEQLVADGFAVSAAAWIKASEDGMWFLYIASPVVDKDRSSQAYRRVYSLMKQMGPLAFHPLEVKLIGAANPIAKDAAAARDRRPGGTWFRGDRLGDLAIDQAYLYSSPSSPQRSGVA